MLPISTCRARTSRLREQAWKLLDECIRDKSTILEILICAVQGIYIYNICMAMNRWGYLFTARLSTLR